MVLKTRWCDMKYNKKRKLNKKVVLLFVLLILTVINFLIYINITKINAKLEKMGFYESYTYKIEEIKNYPYKLQLKSAYGDVQAFHPKILNFEKEWNGYKYWIVYSPYPRSDDSKENPHLMVSNDLVNWKEPEGFDNPIEPAPEDYVASVIYNSDPHLVYNSDSDEIECWWRYVNNITGKVIIYRRTSKDGVIWNEKELVLEALRKEKDYISPAIIYENGIYRLWYVDKGYSVKFIESKDLENWSEDIILDIEYKQDLSSWHLDVIHTKKGYEMLLVAFPSWKYRNNMCLYYTTSQDNTNWKKAEEILCPTSKTNNWDNKGIYRSSFIYENGKYYVFYSGTSKKNDKGIGLIFGKNINQLSAYKS